MGVCTYPRSRRRAELEARGESPRRRRFGNVDGSARRERLDPLRELLEHDGVLRHPLRELRARVRVGRGAQAELERREDAWESLDELLHPRAPARGEEELDDEERVGVAARLHGVHRHAEHRAEPVRDAQLFPREAPLVRVAFDVLPELHVARRVHAARNALPGAEREAQVGLAERLEVRVGYRPRRPRRDERPRPVCPLLRHPRLHQRR
mmetsp:Transcript_23519/g.76515  ORF Transcript_23519/g.76515 Transcript_23519/m.76515 type:complete len:210 (+) Transcript_23519:1118-1747(+)